MVKRAYIHVDDRAEDLVALWQKGSDLRIANPRFLRDGHSRHLDKLALLIAALYRAAKVERTTDVYQFSHPDPEGFIVILTHDAVEVRLPTLEWPHPHFAVPSSRAFQRISLNGNVQDLDLIRELISQAQAARKAESQPCIHCQRPTLPEHAHSLDGDWVCHGCAETHRGIIH